MHATTWMNLENMKWKYEMSRLGEFFIVIGSRLVIAYGWRIWEKMGEELLMGMGFFLWVMKYSKIECGDIAQLCGYTKNHNIVHFEWVNIMVCELYLDKAIFTNRPLSHVRGERLTGITHTKG